MRVLFDTNVVLDVLLNRQPWVKEAAALWQAIDDREIVGYLVASSLTDIFYIAHRLTDLKTAHHAVRLCLAAFEICPVDRQTLEQAQGLAGDDFEDNVQIASAEIAGLDAIATRDTGGLVGATIPVLTPADLLRQLTS
jgi:predicted nucleic acid-binding protein